MLWTGSDVELSRPESSPIEPEMGVVASDDFFSRRNDFKSDEVAEDGDFVGDDPVTAGAVPLVSETYFELV